jgi:DNA transformation protein
MGPRSAAVDPKGRNLASMPASFEVLPNLGPKSQAMLASVGITSLAELRRLGAVAAYAKTKKLNPSASLNLLWALEGALTGISWQQVAREHRTSLLLALEAHESGA